MTFRTPSDAFSDRPSRGRRREQLDHDRQTRRVKIALPISGDPRPYSGRSTPPYGIGLIPAIVTTAITACSGTTPGTGNAQLYYRATPDATSATADADNASVTVLNWYTSSGTIAVGKHINVYWWSNAYWFANGDC